MLSVNMKAKSVFTPGDAPIAELKVKADDNFSGKVICQVKDIPGWTCKLNCDIVNPDGTKGVLSVEQKNYRKIQRLPSCDHSLVAR
ncbi:MAG: hypothetical protein L6U16_12815 [Porphyromonadaceae bacterium]|nr:MAG: hypothetical protein L6U16_12815 [Porphyromonadaceae bacterium]